jgi:hypothetical protein
MTAGYVPEGAHFNECGQGWQLYWFVLPDSVSFLGL